MKRAVKGQTPRLKGRPIGNKTHPKSVGLNFLTKYSIVKNQSLLVGMPMEKSISLITCLIDTWKNMPINRPSSGSPTWSIRNKFIG